VLEEDEEALLLSQISNFTGVPRGNEEEFPGDDFLNSPRSSLAIIVNFL